MAPISWNRAGNSARRAARALAEAMTYQDAFTFSDAYPVMGEPPDFTVHGHINRYLEGWLGVLANQGHVLNPPISEVVQLPG
jgi:uncharacterized protein YqiB (DUF1249 family)